MCDRDLDQEDEEYIRVRLEPDRRSFSVNNSIDYDHIDGIAEVRIRLRLFTFFCEGAQT
jgi:hypothetical protein